MYTTPSQKVVEAAEEGNAAAKAALLKYHNAKNKYNHIAMENHKLEAQYESDLSAW